MPVIFPEVSTGFTQVLLTGSFTTGGQPASGTLTFTLTQAMASGGSLQPPAPVTVTLDAEGSFSIALAANDDPTTVPQGVRYGVTEQIVGAQPRDYFITIPHTAATVDLSTLMPGEQGWT